MTDREFRGRFGGDDPPADTSNTIITENSMEAIVAISEGPIRGLVDGAKSFYIGDTPLQSPDGSLNYKNFTLGVFNGYGETITSAQGGRRATAIDLAGRNIKDAVQTSVNPRVIDCPSHGYITGVAKDGIQLNCRARVTVRTNIAQLVGGATEETIVARVGGGHSQRHRRF